MATTIRVLDESTTPAFTAYFCPQCLYIGTGRGAATKAQIQRDHEELHAVAAARAEFERDRRMD